MKRLCWFALWLNFTTGWAADVVKVWQLTTNQLGMASIPFTPSLVGVSPDGASLVRIIGNNIGRLYWIVDGRILWMNEEIGIISQLVPLLLTTTNVAFAERSPSASAVRWVRLVGDFLGEKRIEIAGNLNRIDGFHDEELSEKYLPSQSIPHFLTVSLEDGTLTCWRLDDPDIWPAPSVSASATNGNPLETRIVNRSGLPIDLQSSTNLTQWTSIRRINALPSTNTVPLPTGPEPQGFLRAVPAEARIQPLGQ